MNTILQSMTVVDPLLPAAAKRNGKASIKKSPGKKKVKLEKL